MQALAFLIFYQRCWKSSKIRPSSHFPLAGRLQVSPPTSTQEKGHTPWQAPHPWLLLLLLLFPGSQAQSKAHVLHKEAGQTLTVRCQYPSTSSLYEMKGWCKEASAFKCIRLVTSSKPRTLASISRFSIWDDPDAGFFTVITTDLREEDSGHYWCRIYRPSDNSVSKSVRFYLVVSPASAFTRTTWAPRDLVSSQIQTQSCVPPTEGAREAPESPSAITVPSHPSSPLLVPPPSRPQNSTLRPGPAAPSALLPVLCGLLGAKSLVLSALLVWWVLRNQHMPPQGRSLLHPAQRSPQAHRHFPLSHRTPGGQQVSNKAGLPGAPPGPLHSLQRKSQNSIQGLWPHPPYGAEAFLPGPLLAHPQFALDPIVRAKPNTCSTFSPSLSH
nr:natural cytotoxicity triggering receptor 2 isoform X1 [Aotus nancymaae]